MFEIKITEIKTAEVTKNPSWEILEKRPDGSDVRGYTPVIVTEVEQRVERFHQVVDEIDLVAVIKAVNGI